MEISIQNTKDGKRKLDKFCGVFTTREGAGGECDERKLFRYFVQKKKLRYPLSNFEIPMVMKTSVSMMLRSMTLRTLLASGEVRLPYTGRNTVGLLPRIKIRDFLKMLKTSLKKLIVAGGMGGLLIYFLPWDLPVTIIGILLVFIWFPLLLLSVFDQIDEFKWRKERRGLSAVMKIILATPKALLGIVSVLFGVAIVVWVFYNVFIERQPQYTGPDMVYSIASFGIGPALIFVGRYWIVSAFKKNETSVELIELT